MRGPKPLYLLHQLVAERARVKLLCGSCTWSRTYDAGAISARLHEMKLLRPSTLITDVARQVQWPCPACARMRWVTVPAPNRRTQFIENPIIPPRRAR